MYRLQYDFITKYDRKPVHADVFVGAMVQVLKGPGGQVCDRICVYGKEDDPDAAGSILSIADCDEELPYDMFPLNADKYRHEFIAALVAQNLIEFCDFLVRCKNPDNSSPIRYQDYPVYRWIGKCDVTVVG